MTIIKPMSNVCSVGFVIGEMLFLRGIRLLCIKVRQTEATPTFWTHHPGL